MPSFSGDEFRMEDMGRLRAQSPARDAIEQEINDALESHYNQVKPESKDSENLH